MLYPDTIGIIADDLTGANDTALQFFLKGCNTLILYDENGLPESFDKVKVFAISTESRNVSPEDAAKKVKSVASAFRDKLKTENLYKKIDSTMRGNVAAEISALIEEFGYDAALIMPAFPNEGRTTVGGFHLLKGVPVERTEFAGDPGAPITESHIPTILYNDLPENLRDKIALIDFRIVKQGAGPILYKLNELISKGFRFIVVDAISSTDIEQVIFALNKSPKKILPCGSAGAARAVAEIWLDEAENNEVKSPVLPDLPRFVVSGSATNVVAAQIKKLEDYDVDNIYFVDLCANDIVNGKKGEIVDKILRNLVRNYTVVLHTSKLFADKLALSDFLIENELSKSAFLTKISDCLGEIAASVLAQRQAFLVTVGGETSQKCFKYLNCKTFKPIDAVLPAIPLCIDSEGRYLVTKSGNLGGTNTLVEILKYFDMHSIK